MTFETDPAATDVQLDADTLTITLEDGRQLRVPLARYLRLAAGSDVERNHWELLGGGYAIYWAELDEHIGIEGLLVGRKSSGNQDSFERWLAARKVG
ncbi:DUF2442 domain-containing protein [soil metagenome]